MKKLKILSAVLLILGVTSCSNDNSFYKSSLIDKEFVIEKTDEFIIHHADSSNLIGKLRFTFVSDTSGSLHAFYDEMKRRFVIVNSEGEIQQIVSEKGRGPGEITKAAGFNIDNKNRLVVFDQSQMMIKVFSLDGKLIGNSRPEKSSYSITGRKFELYKDNIVSPTMDRRYLGNLRKEGYKSKLAAVHSYEGELIDTIGTYDPTVRETKSYNIFPIIKVDKKNDRIISTHFSNYRIQIYDLKDHKRTGWFGRKTKHFNEGEEYISPQLPREKIQEMNVGCSSAVSTHILPEYIVIYFETLTEAFYETDNFNEKESYIALYDKETYDSYGDVVLPYILGNVTNGKFYLIENDNPNKFTVGVYELNENS